MVRDRIAAISGLAPRAGLRAAPSKKFSKKRCAAMRLRALIVVLTLTTASAAAQEMSKSPSDKADCIRDAQAQFADLVEGIVRSAVMQLGRIGKNDYLTAPRPTAFALCIDWERSTPQFRSGRGTGFASRRSSNAGQEAVDRAALRYCEEALVGQSDGHCRCEIVHRNGVLALSFPDNWPKGCDR